MLSRGEIQVWVEFCSKICSFYKYIIHLWVSETCCTCLFSHVDIKTYSLVILALCFERVSPGLFRTKVSFKECIPCFYWVLILSTALDKRSGSEHTFHLLHVYPDINWLRVLTLMFSFFSLIIMLLLRFSGWEGALFKTKVVAAPPCTADKGNSKCENALLLECTPSFTSAVFPYWACMWQNASVDINHMLKFWIDWIQL